MNNLLTAQNALTAILLTGALYGGYVLRGWTHQTEARMLVEFEKHAMTKSDLPEPTTASAVTVYEEPDSTRTECIEVPTWIPRLQDSPESTVPDTHLAADTTSTRSTRAQRDGVMTTGSTPSELLSGLPYVITPMTNGRPSLSVGPQQVVLPGILPTNGQGVKWTYDIPQQNNRLSPYATMQLLPGTAAVHTGLQYARTWRDVPLFSSMTAEWSAGYGLTEHGAGAVGSVTVTADVRW